MGEMVNFEAVITIFDESTQAIGYSKPTRAEIPRIGSNLAPNRASLTTACGN